MDHGYLVAVSGGHGQVVGDDDHGESLLPAEPFNQIEDLELHVDVEMESGFVHQQYLRCLGDGAGDDGPLPLPSAHGVDVSVLHVLQAGAADSFVNDPHILRRESGEGFLEGHAAHLHDFPDREGEVDLVGLGDYGYPTGDVLLLQAFEVAAVHDHTSVMGSEVAVEVLQQGGFAASVGPEDTDDPAFADAEGYAL